MQELLKDPKKTKAPPPMTHWYYPVDMKTKRSGDQLMYRLCDPSVKKRRGELTDDLKTVECIVCDELQRKRKQ